MEVGDPKALEVAGDGCDLVRVETTNWDWFGKWVNDYHGDDAAYKRLGVDPKTYGQCEWALVQKDSPIGRAELEARKRGGRLTHADVVAIREQEKSAGRTLPYSVGVVRHPTKPGKLAILYDFWSGGYGLKAKIGEEANLLRQGYGGAAVRNVLARKPGHTITVDRKLDDGRRHIRVRVPRS
jgi:hypothetical protein